MLQVTKNGITLCDPGAAVDVCKSICQSNIATCAFNGVCLCRNNWGAFFNLSMNHVRKEVSSDHNECSKRCSEVTLYSNN